jgi:hypothetical protein
MVVIKAKRDAVGEARLEARREAQPTTRPDKPALARAEIVDKPTRRRFETELDAALKRRSTSEAKLAGALRSIAPMSGALRAVLADVADTMIRRGSLQRELYAASIRALAEVEDKHAVGLVKRALATDEAGGAAALSAACFSRDPSLREILAKVAGSRQSHLAFGAETARVVRGESNGAHLAALAPMIKESHRIAMCTELFVPLVRAPLRACNVGPALTVLRGAERHLGRWLVLGEVAAKAGDKTPLDEANARAGEGAPSSRAAWALVKWALDGTLSNGARDSVVPPQTRPTLELIARLSDRPSADRDTTFLFRMAHAGATATRPMLEASVKVLPLDDDNAVRAALYLARDHSRGDMRDALIESASSSRREELRGLAAASLWDAGERVRAREIADDLVASKHIGNVAWGARIRAAAKMTPAKNGSRPGDGGGGDRGEALVGETHFRWIQCGWLE